MKKLLWLGLIAAVALLGCDFMSRDFYRTAEDFPENGKGMLVLGLDGSEVEARTIAPPDGTMDILSYHIYGSGDHSSNPTFEVNVNIADLTGGDTYSRNDLLPGTWTIQVTAYNASGGEAGSGARIGYGEINDLFISPNSLITDSVDISPDIGGSYTGLLSLAVYWVADTVSSPVVVAELTGGTAGTSDVSLGGSFSYSSTGATFTDYSLVAGYYTLSIDLYTGSALPENKVMGDDQSVRIVNNQSSSGSWDLGSTPGKADITISPDLNNPITIVLNVDNLFTSRVVSATLTDAPSGSYFTYDWYEDGVLMQSTGATAITATSDNYTVTDFDAGTGHNLSVVVTEYDAADTSSATVNTISSETHSFTEQ